MMRSDSEIKDIERRIDNEKARLTKVFVSIEAPKKAVIRGLIERAAYMRVTLVDMEADLIESGAIEMFSQSENAEPYERERPIARIYNTVNKNYQAIIRQLTDCLPPPQTSKQPDDEVGRFFDAKRQHGPRERPNGVTTSDKPDTCVRGENQKRRSRGRAKDTGSVHKTGS